MIGCLKGGAKMDTCMPMPWGKLLISLNMKYNKKKTIAVHDCVPTFINDRMSQRQSKDGHVYADAMG